MHQALMVKVKDVPEILKSLSHPPNAAQHEHAPLLKSAP